ncbi:hypothetical protein [Paraburkholderia sp. BCC1886]|uniref:hypothetical protein n=1 Tax=Paraburkholderia sp. BCC1886 TaxID=2562670 RepID=UPI0021B20B77|nr:hypothetical protein [Paraburkholderia sp. BCC1886]
MQTTIEDDFVEGLRLQQTRETSHSSAMRKKEEYRIGKELLDAVKQVRAKPVEALLEGVVVRDGRRTVRGCTGRDARLSESVERPPRIGLDALAEFIWRTHSKSSLLEKYEFESR